MNATMARGSIVNPPKLAKVLLVAVFLAAGGLSLKTAYDLAIYAEMFPAWFVPLFILAVTVLIATSLHFVLQVWTKGNNLRPITSRQSSLLWILMLLSFICTTSVHRFLPFSRDILEILPVVNSVSQINYAIGLIGFVACTVLTCIYFFRKAQNLAMIGLLLLALGMLIPNDNCANPFNYWWIDTIGASPLMYVPNMYAALFVTSGLYGVQPNRAGLVLFGICLSGLVLGLGHQFRIIW